MILAGIDEWVAIDIDTRPTPELWRRVVLLGLPLPWLPQITPR
jgi:hypothetical protein